LVESEPKDELNALSSNVVMFSSCDPSNACGLQKSGFRLEGSRKSRPEELGEITMSFLKSCRTSDGNDNAVFGNIKRM
jgi:hypothetical protein